MVEGILTLKVRVRVGMLFSPQAGICVWLRVGTLRTTPMELDCGHGDHDQGHDEGDGVEIQWDRRHGWLVGERMLMLADWGM